jgi:adenine-specific DNA methylase
MKYIEKDFPIERLNEIARKESVVSLKKPVYLLHRWWARRLGCVFRSIALTSFLQADISEEEYWRNYFYNKTDLEKILGYSPIILDPFMGGGATVVEALRLGFKSIGIDINPVAWFATKKELDPFDEEAFDNAFQKLEETAGNKIKSYYKTRCPICDKENSRTYEWEEGNGELADVMYVFWINKIKCLNPTCKKDIYLFPSFKIATKKGKSGVTTHTVFCPECGNIFETEKDEVETRCPQCEFEFIPSRGYIGRLKDENGNTLRKSGEYSCPHCGQRYNVLDSVRKSGHIPEREMYAIEFYCPVHGRGYKKADENDRELFKKAKKELEEQWDDLIGKYIPDQEIPKGKETYPRLSNYNYKYFYEMFNERQLLCLSMLLKEILKVEDENIKEYFLITFSTILEYNNMFCRYIQTMRYIENLFSLHAYYPKNDPLENNLWGTKVGKGTFKGYAKKSIRSKKYCLEPYEYKISNKKGRVVDKIYTNDKIIGNFSSAFESLLNGDENVLLLSQTSEDLSFIDNQSIDAVITDPPYYDNVMYSELADFFYVWLRLGLKDKYPWFRAGTTRNKREIIKNEMQGKDENFFLKGIQRVFSECSRVLKEDGIMVFTFHHKETEAWASMLLPILKSNFYIKAVYPIHSEMTESPHISSKKAISYDTIIVCKKRAGEPSAVSWNTLKGQIYKEIKEVIERLRKNRPYLGEGNIFVIALGKGLEIYSKNYPSVLYKEGYLEPKEATLLMGDLVDTLSQEIKELELPSDLDEVSKIYIGYLLGESYVEYDSLNKILRSRTFDISLLEREKLIEKGKKNQYKVEGAAKRYSFINEKIENNGNLSYIDKIHYLLYLYRRGKPIINLIGKWKDETLSRTLSIYCEKIKDEDCKKVHEMLEKHIEMEMPTLESFGGGA